MWKNNRAKSRTEAPRTTFFSLAEEKSTLMKESIEQLLSKVNRLISTAEQVTKIPKDNIHTVQRLDELPEETAPNVASSNEYVAQLEQQKAKLSQMHSIEQKLKEAEKKLEDSEKKKLEDAKKVTQLQSANEKLQSANEKLQSTNEKLNEKMHLMESEMQFQTKDEVALKSSHEKSEDCAETQKKLTDQTETIENATKFLAKLDTSMLETIRVKGGDTFADALAPFADIKVVTSKDVKTDRGSNMGTIENLVTKVIAWEKENGQSQSSLLPVGHLQVQKGILSTVSLFDELDIARVLQTIDALRNDWVEAPWVEHARKWTEGLLNGFKETLVSKDLFDFAVRQEGATKLLRGGAPGFLAALGSNPLAGLKKRRPPKAPNKPSPKTEAAATDESSMDYPPEWGSLAATVRLSTETKFHEAKERLIKKKTQALRTAKHAWKQVCADGKAAERWNRLEQDLLVLFRDEPTDERGGGAAKDLTKKGYSAIRTLLEFSIVKGTGDAGTSKKKAVDGVALKEDERFQKYFKMLSVGLPAEAVKHKMTQDKVDPAILDMDRSKPYVEPKQGAVTSSKPQAAVTCEEKVKEPKAMATKGSPFQVSSLTPLPALELTVVRKKWSDDLQDDSETVGPLPEIADQSVEDALRQYWDEVEAMKKLLVEMHRDAHRNLRVQVGEKKVSPTDFETHMRSMVDQRNALYDRLYKDSLFNPQRLPHAQTLPTTFYPGPL